MQKNFDKYFWDGRENISGAFAVKRILEYASFPDLIAYPFEEIKKYIVELPIDQLRTSQKRKSFLKMLLPLLQLSETWDEVFEKLLHPEGTDKLLGERKPDIDE